MKLFKITLSTIILEKCIFPSNMNITNNILKYTLNNFQNRKLLIEDGITTNKLIIDKFDNIFEKSIFQISNIKKINPEVGKAVSIIKNIDEYQYILGEIIPELGDDNIFKLDMQKSRVYIFCMIQLVIDYLKKNQFQKVVEWNKYTSDMLEEISDFYVDYAKNEFNKKLNFAKISKYFGIDEDFIDQTLKNYYN